MIKLKIKNVCGTKRAYPDNKLGELFLKLASARRAREAKSFTDKELEIIADISNELKFTIDFTTQSQQ